MNFALRNAGEALGLAGPSGAFIQNLSFGAQLTGVSEGRLPDGSANIVKFPTSASPGDANYLPLGNIVINEVLSHTDLGGNFEDAIEILNAGPATNISGWYLSDSKTVLNKYQIPAGPNILMATPLRSTRPRAMKSISRRRPTASLRAIARRLSSARRQTPYHSAAIPTASARSISPR
ncbi:MAG: hypothetical protein DME57_00880 [Verrucomicrobia bacterium]|nr:MAG: hypothetical protein DME57_00880 [Verrucomicrobiota bacterium]